MQNYIFTETLTRPANNTPYTAGDVVADKDSSTVFELIPSGTLNRGGDIVHALLTVDHNDTTNATFRLFLFDGSSNQATIADNAAHTMTQAAAADLFGVLDFTLVASSFGSGSAIGTMDDVSPNFAIPIPTSNSGVYGRLVATGAYIPKLGGTFQLIVNVKEA